MLIGRIERPRNKGAEQDKDCVRELCRLEASREQTVVVS